MRICVYCAASEKVDEKYKKFMKVLGKQIAKRGHTLVYGGGAGGLMGAVAYGAIEEKGEVLSVVPNFMNEFEPIMEGTTIIHTLDMGTRKNIMEDNTDGFIIAPGGIGTFDEFFQALTLKELGRLSCPMLIYNIDGYYDELASFLFGCVEKQFVRAKVREMLYVCDTDDDMDASAIRAIEYLEERYTPRT